MKLPPKTPPWAAKIWSDQDYIYLDLGHTIRLPNDEDGLTKALFVIRSRDESSTVATNGGLTQYQIDAAVAEHIRKYGVRRAAKEKYHFNPSIKASARDVLRKLGMI